MITSKFLTASLTALAVVGSAGFVYAQTTTTPDSSVQAQPAAPVTGDMNRSTDTLNQGTGTGTGTMNQGTGTLGQGTDTTNQGTGTLSQGTDTLNQDRSMDQQLAARADRN